MDSLKIDDHIYELQGVCASCKRFDKCKDKQKLCWTKKMVFRIAVVEYKKRVKRGELK